MMAVPFWRVKYQSKVSGDAVTLFAQEVTVRTAIESKANSANVVLRNINAKFASTFQEDDTIQVFASNEGINEDTDLLMNAKIKKFGQQSTAKGRLIGPKGMDHTYLLLNKIYMKPGFRQDDSKKVHEAVIDIIEWISSIEDRESRITTNNVQTTVTKKTNDPSGTATFKDVDITLNMKTAYEWIQKLSETPSTDYGISGQGETTYSHDRSFIFWVDKDNDLHWIYPAQTIDFSLTYGQNGIISTDLKKNVFDVINMVIFNCGKDPNGNGIQWYFYDDRTETPDIRIRVQPMLNIARDLQSEEKKLVTFVGEFPEPAAYPYTTSWGESVANDDEYTGTSFPKTGFRGECIRRAEQKSREITRQTANLRWSGRIVLKGTSDYTAGQVLGYTYDDYDMVDQKLRVHEVTHNLNKNGWITTLTIKEDEETLT